MNFRKNVFIFYFYLFQEDNKGNESYDDDTKKLQVNIENETSVEFEK